MRTSRVTVIALLVVATLCPALPVLAQGTVADYQRAMGMREKYQELAPNVPEPATWIEKTARFWYRRSVKGGNEFVLVDADTLQKRPAFDHEKLAAALTTALAPEKAYTGVTLPFTTFTFVDGERAIEVTANGTTWRCALDDYRCSDRPAGGTRRPGRPWRTGGGGLGRTRARRNRRQRRRAEEVARRQARGARQQLQRGDPRDREDGNHAAQHRRLGRRLLRSQLDRLVAGLEEDRRLQGQAGLSPLRALRPVVARRSAAAEALDAPVRQARRRPRRREAGALPRRHQRSRSWSTMRSSRTPTTTCRSTWRKDSAP